jgi:hypothetical protein
VLAADADFQVGARLASELRGHFDKLADPGLIDHCKRIVREDLLVDVVLQSSRERPIQVCVRSLVPKLKNLVSLEKSSLYQDHAQLPLCPCMCTYCILDARKQ